MKYAEMSDKQKKYDQEWKSKNIKQFKIGLSRNTDADIIEFLDTLDNKQGYIKDLIREDIEKKQSH